MSDHNRWMNEKLYAVCAGIPDEARTRDLGDFFRSIHGTLNHLLPVDRLWRGRITAWSFVIRSLDQELYAHFDTLRRERADTDVVIAGFIAGLQSARLAVPVMYNSLVKQESVYPPRSDPGPPVPSPDPPSQPDHDVDLAPRLRLR